MNSQVDEGEAEREWGEMERQVREGGENQEPWDGFVMLRKQNKSGSYSMQIKAPKGKRKVSSPQAL